MRRVCTGTTVHYEQTVRVSCIGNEWRLHRYTISKESEVELRMEQVARPCGRGTSGMCTGDSISAASRTHQAANL
jgi:hypothetical protein